MLTYLQRLVDERTSLTETVAAMTDGAAAENRDLSDTEQASVASIATRCAEIDGQLVQYNGQAESTRAFADLTARIEARNADRRDATSSTTPPAAGPGLESTGIGAAFVASEQFRSYPGRGQGLVLEYGEALLETRAAITTANLAIPHFTWAPIEYQTRAPLLEVCGHVMVSTGVVDWVEIGGDPQAAVVAEGAVKPEATFSATPKTSALDTIAHYVQITRQALDDATYIQSLLESKLRRGLLNKAEADMAAAIDASTAVQTATATAAQGGLLAAIRVGIGKVEGAGFNPNAVALNPADYAALDVDVMGKTNAGPVRAATFWGMTPVSAAAIPAGKAYVGDFQAGATLFDRGVTSVYVTDSHAALFVSNILVILAEARLKSAVTTPPAICECSAIP